jgi:hypothetical protein
MRNVVLLNNPVLEYRPDSSVPVNITAVAERIAILLGGTMASIEEAGENPYYVPFAAVHAPLAQIHEITGNGDVYGGIVRDLEHADKAILHELPSSEATHPNWYSPAFAKAVGEVVLPGFTSFTSEDTMQAFDTMQERGLAVRFKDPSATGGMGQFLVQSRSELAEAMVAYQDRIPKVGAVLEANLQDHQTVTIGHVDINGQTYSWYGRPYDIEHNGMTRFGGNKLTVTRGSVQGLEQYATDPRDQLAIRQAGRVFDEYGSLGTIVTRATLDAVQGLDSNGQFISGITDPSLRPSASSAAEIRAIEAFAANPDANVVRTRLTYDYAKTIPTDGSHGELFVSHLRMNIFVELVDIA